MYPVKSKNQIFHLILIEVLIFLHEPEVWCFAVGGSEILSCNFCFVALTPTPGKYYFHLAGNTPLQKFLKLLEENVTYTAAISLRKQL